jgi:uncharacterized damage-inducible protein DinB
VLFSTARTLLEEFDRETTATRRLLACVPDRLAWQPHPRSMTLGELGQHIVDVLGYARNLLVEPGYEMRDAAGPRRTCTSPADLLAAFEAGVAATRVLLLDTTDLTLFERWRLSRGRDELFSAPRGLVVRRFLLNHLIHHRAQLTVYLRMLDVAIPGLYGPSADEVS